jgi:excisionase family DNA binding protein
LICLPVSVSQVTDCPSFVNQSQTSQRNADNIEVHSVCITDRIEQTGHAITANELSKILAVSHVTIFKQAKAGRIPSFRIGTCVRFDPRAVANWLRKM